MNAITVPSEMVASFQIAGEARVCDETGKILGYYTPVREATEEDYEWAMKQVSPEEIELSLKSGVGRTPSEIIADLERKYGK